MSTPTPPSSGGILDRHAPQVIFVTVGAILAILKALDIQVGPGAINTINEVVNILVPPAIAWIGAIITERYTWAKRTVDGYLEKLHRLEGQGRSAGGTSEPFGS
jgi:hypothetical protein